MASLRKTVSLMVVFLSPLLIAAIGSSIGNLFESSGADFYFVWGGYLLGISVGMYTLFSRELSRERLRLLAVFTGPVWVVLIIVIGFLVDCVNGRCI